MCIVGSVLNEIEIQFPFMPAISWEFAITIELPMRYIEPCR